eukprot:scaffold3036_cov414-Prasinococcus_capsulatus_cf.AAC.13
MHRGAYLWIVLKNRRTQGQGYRGRLTYPCLPPTDSLRQLCSSLSLILRPFSMRGVPSFVGIAGSR